MSNQNTLYLSSNYGHTQKLNSLDKQLMAFLEGRGHKVLNLNLYKLTSTSDVFEKSLSLLKHKPLTIAVIDQIMVIPTTLITLAFKQGCRCVVFSTEAVYPQFKALTNKNLNLYPSLNNEQIINTLKLYQI